MDAQHWTLSLSGLNSSIPLNLTVLRLVLNVIFPFTPGPKSDLFPSDIPLKISYSILISYVSDACPAHLILHFIILVLRSSYELWSSSLCISHRLCNFQPLVLTLSAGFKRGIVRSTSRNNILSPSPQETWPHDNMKQRVNYCFRIFDTTCNNKMFLTEWNKVLLEFNLFWIYFVHEIVVYYSRAKISEICSFFKTFIRHLSWWNLTTYLVSSTFISIPISCSL